MTPLTEFLAIQTILSLAAVVALVWIAINDTNENNEEGKS